MPTDSQLARHIPVPATSPDTGTELAALPRPTKPDAHIRRDIANASTPNEPTTLNTNAAREYDSIRRGGAAIGHDTMGGPAVQQLKTDLNAIAQKFRDQGVVVPGLTDSQALDATSDGYDAATADAVRALQRWQQSQDLDTSVWDSRSQYSQVDGVVGLRTMRTIDSLLGRPAILSKQEFAEHLAAISAIVGYDSDYQAVSYRDAWNHWQSEYDGELGMDANGAIPYSGRRYPEKRETLYSVDVDFISQFSRRVPGHGRMACFRACQTMAETAGVDMPSSTVDRIQVAAREDQRSGRLTRLSRDGLARGVAAIDGELAAGRPVIIGVSHSGGRDYNRDGMTDHFVLVTGKHIDQNGNTFYTAHDPSTRRIGMGADQRFYVAEDGNLVKEGNSARGPVAARHQEMAMVIPASTAPYRS